jgi:acyl-coenzyme A thioesterase PaaI-like protein
MNMMAASPATTPPADAVVPSRAEGAPEAGSQLPAHYRLCFGCGVDHASGLHLRVAAGHGASVQGEFTVSEHHQGAPGLAHGGILAAALDEVMGALNWLLMMPAVTARIEVDYLRPVAVGTTMQFSATIVGQAGRKVFSMAEGTLDGPAGVLAVRARGLFLQVGLEHFQRNGRPDEVARAAQEMTGSPQRPWLEINP